MLLLRSSEQAGVRDALASMTGDQVDVTVRLIDPRGSVAETRTAVDDATAQAYGSQVEWSSTGWATTAWRTTAAGVYSYLVELDDPSAQAELVEGSWPTSGLGIALPEAAARSLGLTVGDAFTLDDSEDSVEFHVDGLYQAAPESGQFWENDPLASAGNVADFPEPGRSFYSPVHAVGPLIVAPNGIDTSDIPSAQQVVTLHPSFTSTNVAGLATLRDRAADAENEIARGISQPGGRLIVDTNMDVALDAVDAGLAATRAAVLVIILLVIVVVAVAVASVLRLLVEARAPELEMLRTRGASRWQTASIVALDGAAIAFLVSVASPWGGVLLHALIAGTAPLNQSGIELWVLADASVWAAAIVFALVMAILLCLPVAPPRRRSTTTWVAAVIAALEVSLVVTATLIIWRVSTIEPVSGDVLLAAAPAVVLAAVAIIGSRVLTVVIALIASVTAKARGAILPLAGWFAARRSGRSSGVVLVALTVGAAVVILGVNATWQQSVRNEAAIAVGASARVTADDIDVALAEETSGDAAPVLRRQTVLSKQDPAGAEGGAPTASVQLLGLGSAARSMLDEGPAAQAGGAAIYERLEQDATADIGPTLPEDTASLEAKATLEGPEGTVAEVFIVVEDSAGTLTAVSLGSVVADGREGALAAPIELHSFPGDTRVVAVTMRVAPDAAPAEATPIALTMDAVTTTTASGAATSSQIAWLEASQWLGWNSIDQRDLPTVTVTDSTIRLAAVAGLGAGPVTYGALGWEPLTAIDALIPTSLADDLDVATGTEIGGFIAGTPVSFRIVGHTPAVPGSATADDVSALEVGLRSPSRSGLTIVADGKGLAHRLVQVSASGPLVDEYWLGSPASSDLLAREGSSTGIMDAAVLGQRMMEAPLRAAIPAASSLAVWASLLLALAGFGARTAAISRSRRLESAQLRALGLSQRAMLVVASVDAGLIAAVGIAIGLGAGVLTLGLLGERIVSARGGASIDLSVPVPAVTLLPLALIAALAIVSIGIANGQRRLPLAELLRAGADG